MPLYEFVCANCGRKFSDLVGMTSDSAPTACPSCDSTDVKRLVSRVGKFRTEEQRLDALTERVEGMAEPDSYDEMRSVIREAGSAMDEDLADDMEEMFESDVESASPEE